MFTSSCRIALFVISLLLFSGCSSTNEHYAPVIDLNTQYAKQKGYYTVTAGDTLYFIAWRFEMSYQKLAQINHIQAPYSLRVGQRIYLRAAKKTAKTVTTSSKVIPIKQVTPIKEKTLIKLESPIKLGNVSHWIWPAKGAVVQQYSSSNKGVNILGAEGENVMASAAGQVVYAGDGLRAYGNLIIIKHNDTYLSAYAHNEDLLVKEGEWVKQGQVIAHMGSTGTNKVMLHFEIRKDGKPVNPRSYLR